MSQPSDMSGGNEPKDLEAGDNPEARGASSSSGTGKPMGEQAASSQQPGGSGMGSEMGSEQAGGEQMAAAMESPAANESMTAMEGGEGPAQEMCSNETSPQEFKEDRM